MDGVANSPEKMERYIRTIYAKTQDLDRLIDDLFLFSKLDLGKLPFNYEKIDIKSFFDDCIEELQLEYEKKGIRLSLQNGTAGVLAVADREKLKRVVINIFDNAAKYMGRDKGSITVRLTEDSDGITVAITDSGQGISSEDLPCIFDRFFRTDKSRNSSTGGSGLGLAIARQIIEGHGGRIWAESEVGSGTSIYFTLKRFHEGGKLPEVKG
jgi:signal transduction histidine kinase